VSVDGAGGHVPKRRYTARHQCQGCPKSGGIGSGLCRLTVLVGMSEAGAIQPDTNAKAAPNPVGVSLLAKALS